MTSSDLGSTVTVTGMPTTVYAAVAFSIHSTGGIDSANGQRTAASVGTSGPTNPSTSPSSANDLLVAPLCINSGQGTFTAASGLTVNASQDQVWLMTDNLTASGATGNFVNTVTTAKAAMGWSISFAASPTPTPTASPTPGIALYVTNSTVNDVTVYPLGPSGNATPISSGPELAGPNGIARDSSGNIYAANQTDNTITIYASGTAGSASPIGVIGGPSSGLVDPAGVAIDSSGDIYVANNGSAVGLVDSVTVYAPFSEGFIPESPVATIMGTNTGLSYASGVTVDSSGKIYVINGQGGPDSSGSLTVYSPGSNGNATPLATISDNPACAPCDETRLNGPSGLALDAALNIYVVNSGNANPLDDSVTVYPALGNNTGILNNPPLLTIDNSEIEGYENTLIAPQGIALDPNGNEFVTNDASVTIGYDDFAVFSAGFGELNFIDFGDDLYLPAGITVDSSDNAYIADNSASTADAPDSINVYPYDNYTPSSLITSSAQMLVPAGIAEDSVGDILVANDATTSGSQGDWIAAYAPGSYANATPEALIYGSNTQLSLPLGIAFDSDNNLYAVNATGGSNAQGSVTVYLYGHSGNASPVNTISGAHTGLAFPYALTLDSAGNIYVANAVGGPDFQGSITIYPKHGDGNIPPTATISDNPQCAPCDNTELNLPSGITLDASGNIYVSNAGDLNGGSDSITVYPALGTSTGTLNESPTLTISGAATGLDVPQGITLDPNSNLYVLNDGSFNGGTDSVTAYAAGASGNVAPTLTLSGPQTGLGLPTGILIGPTLANGPIRRSMSSQRANWRAFRLTHSAAAFNTHSVRFSETTLALLKTLHTHKASGG